MKSKSSQSLRVFIEITAETPSRRLFSRLFGTRTVQGDVMDDLNNDIL